METRQLWCAPTDPNTIGLAGVAQVVRIRCHAQRVRQGKVVKESDEIRFAVTSDWPQQAGPERLLEVGRGHWRIENGQYYRRDRTQDEDRCPVRDPTTARNLSLFRSLAVFTFKRQSRGQGGKKTLPDFERHVHRKPGRRIRRFTQRRHEEQARSPKHPSRRYAPQRRRSGFASRTPSRFKGEPLLNNEYIGGTYAGTGCPHCEFRLQPCRRRNSFDSRPDPDFVWSQAPARPRPRVGTRNG